MITVLFADLANYTSYSEGRDPEDVRAFLTSYFERATEVVTRFGGVVDKFIGDAVMAVWGASTSNEDDPERAVRAGLELVEAAAKLAADAGAPELGLRVGIHTGEASVGPGGNQMGLVAGDNVNIASRLQSAAVPGTVLVGEGTYQAASRAIAFEPIGAQTVKGKAVPVAAWRALRVVAERGGAGRSEQLEPPFVGRGEELRLLKDLLASVTRESRSRMVSIIGEGGIGKSRLGWEFLKYIDGLVEVIYWHEGRSPAYGDGVTFWAVAEMIRSRAEISEIDADDVARAALRETVSKYVDDQGLAEWVEPRLAAVLGLGAAPLGDRSELDAAVRAFFEGVSQAGTTVLVFEDVHWADTSLLDFIEDLTDWWRDRPILIVALARPDLTDRRPTWGAGHAGMISLRLSPLSDADMREVVTGTVPGLPEDAVAAIVDRAAGIPMYAVEFLRMMLAQGDLEEADGRYRLIGDVTRLAVPESLQAVIGARLDRLEPAERALLQDAAVLGYSFTLDGLVTINQTERSEVEARIAGLVRRELIEPVRDPRSPQRGQFQFLQTLIRDIALGRMSRDTRRSRHLDVAHYYEGLADPELAVVVASHYLDALEATPPGDDERELREKALSSMAAAADRAADLRAHDQVLTISQQALSLADEPALRVPFWERMTEAATRLAKREEAERYGRLALDHHRQSGDVGAVNRMVRMLGFAYVEEQMPFEAVELLESHLSGHADLATDPELARAAALLARALMLSNRDEEAAVTADRALLAAEKQQLMPTVVDALITKATAIGHPGRLVEARILMEGAIALADQLDIAHSSMRGRNNFAHLFGTIDPRGSVLAAVEGFDIAKRTGDRSMAMFLAMNLAGWFGFDLDFDAASTILADPIVQGAPDQLVSGYLATKAWGAWMKGDLELARTLTKESNAMIATEEDPQMVLNRVSGEIALKIMDGELAEALEAALDVCRQGWSGMTNGLDLVIWSLVLLNDRSQIPIVQDLVAPYQTALPLWIRLWDALAQADPGPPSPEVVQAVVDEYGANKQAGWALLAEMAAAQFSPRGHPDRERWLMDARRRADEKQLRGVLEIIDRYVA
ncbi:MAG: adenylate/guanylate cyclase domain-containing protein [Acidimicrobiia bacterium]